MLYHWFTLPLFAHLCWAFQMLILIDNTLALVLLHTSLIIICCHLVKRNSLSVGYFMIIFADHQLAVKDIFISWPSVMLSWSMFVSVAALYVWLLYHGIFQVKQCDDEFTSFYSGVCVCVCVCVCVKYLGLILYI